MSFFKKIKGKKSSSKNSNTPTTTTPESGTPESTTPKDSTTPITQSPKIESKSLDKDSSEIEEIDFGKDAESATPDKKRLWSKISNLVGKDPMSLVSLPVYFFEPLTVLECQIEPLRFFNILEKACKLDDPVERMLYITTYNIAMFSSYVRTAKPFNPLLGETYEYIPDNGKYRSFCEQVSHHPPIGIAETQSELFNLQQESWITTKFWGNSLDVFSLGQNHLIIPGWNNEHYTWKIPSAICHNLILGKMWIEHHGDLTIKNHTSGESAKVTFYKSGWFESTTKKVSGEIKDSKGKTRYIINGRWNEYLNVLPVDDRGFPINSKEFEIWKAVPDPLEKENKWKHGEFLQSLNRYDLDYEKILPSTDSRLRKDRKLLEMGDNKQANREKNSIEEKQREIRKYREEKDIHWKPNYFSKVEDKGFGYRWLFNSEYWKERDERVEGAKSEAPNLRVSQLKEKPTRRGSITTTTTTTTRTFSPSSTPRSSSSSTTPKLKASTSTFTSPKVMMTEYITSEHGESPYMYSPKIKVKQQEEIINPEVGQGST